MKELMVRSCLLRRSLFDLKCVQEEQQKKAKEMAIKAAEVTRIEAMARRAAEEKERSEKAARRQKEIDARDRRHAMALLRTPTTVNLGSPNLDLDLDDFDVDFDDSDSDRTASPVLDLLDDRLERSIEPMIPTSSAKICLPPPQPSISPLKRPFSPAKGPVMTSPPFSPAKGPVMTPGHFSPITGPVTTAAPLAFSPAFGFTPPDKKALLPGHQSPWIGSDRRSKGGLSPSELLAGVSSPGWEPDDHPGFGMNRASPPLISNSSPNGLLRGKGSSAGSPHPSISAPTRSIESVLAPVMLTTSPYKSPVPPQRSPSALFTPPAANNFGMGSPMPSPSQIVIVSSPTVPGYRITHTLGQCWGTAYIPISPDENLPALLNGMDERAQQLTQAGRRDAVKGLLNEAEAMRAMGLINLRFSAPVPSGVSEVQFNASGTAVMLERLPETKETLPPANYLTPRHNPLPPSTISDTPSPRNFTLPDSFDSFSPPMSSKRPSPSESNLISPLTDSPFSSPPTTLASLTERLNQKPLDAWAPAKMLIRDSSPARTPGGKGVYLLD
ncbi:hypothetical protein BT69DRAFT_456623 [Atractiella rhizophila]|nr:hypothetical protein BT69DRAFT_456623 [Atractiella rhizophila]